MCPLLQQGLRPFLVYARLPTRRLPSCLCCSFIFSPFSCAQNTALFISSQLFCWPHLYDRFMFKAVRIHLIRHIMCTYIMDKLLVLVVILCIIIFFSNLVYLPRRFHWVKLNFTLSLWKIKPDLFSPPQTGQAVIRSIFIFWKVETL